MTNKTILIYGDSNVYGEGAFNKVRLPADQRWVSLLTQRLGPDYSVIPEGFSGRTAGDIKTEEWAAHANGKAHFTAVYGSHAPVDVLIVALGTNDCQPKYRQTAKDIVENLRWYSEQVKVYAQKNDHQSVPRVVYVTPPRLDPSGEYFSSDAPMHQQLQQQLYDALIASDLEVIAVPEVALSADGVHFSPEGHEQMAEKVYEWFEEKKV